MMTMLVARGIGPDSQRPFDSVASLRHPAEQSTRRKWITDRARAWGASGGLRDRGTGGRRRESLSIT